MDYRCLELTHESLSDGSFEDTEAGKRNYATCHVLKYRKIRWCQGNGNHTDGSKMFFYIFPLDNWKCWLRNFSTIVVRDVAEMMSLQMMRDEALVGEPQQLDWMVWDGNFVWHLGQWFLPWFLPPFPPSTSILGCQIIQPIICYHEVFMSLLHLNWFYHILKVKQMLL